MSKQKKYPNLLPCPTIFAGGSDIPAPDFWLNIIRNSNYVLRSAQIVTAAAQLNQKGSFQFRTFWQNPENAQLILLKQITHCLIGYEISK